MKRPPRNSPYAPAVRFAGVRALLDSATGASVYDIAERFDVSVRTALRYLEALRAAGEPLYEETTLRRKVWRLMPSARRETLTLTTSQMLSLFLSRRCFDFLPAPVRRPDTWRRASSTAGGGLRRRAAPRPEDLRHHEAPPSTMDASSTNEILTALLREERLDIVHESVEGGRRPARFEPYTLVVYKKGLYLAGLSHAHGQVRTLALDGFRDVTWRRGDGFVYPAAFHPEQLAEGAFGLIKGPPVRARIFFTDKVARYVTRRLWHPPRSFAPPAAASRCRESERDRRAVSWIRSFGDQVEVRAPPREGRRARRDRRDGALRCRRAPGMAGPIPGPARAQPRHAWPGP